MDKKKVGKIHECVVEKTFQRVLFHHNTPEWWDCRHRVSCNEDAARGCFTETSVLKFVTQFIILCVRIWVVQHFV